MKIRRRELVFSLPLTLAWAAYALVFLVGMPIYAMQFIGWLPSCVAPFGLWFVFHMFFKVETE